ncbi:MAG: YIP1 family protein [Anaerolineales bacterium]
MPNKRLRFNWVIGVIAHPRSTFEQIASQTRGVWLIPILLLTLTTIVRVLVSGWIRQGIVMNSGPTLPPDFQYYSPEQQAQYMQAIQATSGPVFLYILPMIASLFGIWIGWILVSGLLHLVATLSGGRGWMGYTVNLVAWASIAFAVRDIVRVAAMLISHQLIGNTGLSGFAPAAEGMTYLSALLSMIDIYVIWYILLLIVGVRAGMGLPVIKATVGVLIVIGTIFGLQALLVYLMSRLGSLTIIRPFF